MTPMSFCDALSLSPSLPRSLSLSLSFSLSFPPTLRHSFFSRFPYDQRELVSQSSTECSRHFGHPWTIRFYMTVVTNLFEAENYSMDMGSCEGQAACCTLKLHIFSVFLSWYVTIIIDPRQCEDNDLVDFSKWLWLLNSDLTKLDTYNSNFQHFILINQSSQSFL